MHMSDPQADIRAVLDAYAAAVTARDVNAFLGLYDDRIHMFDVWGWRETSGLDAWRANVADWFGAHPDERASATFDDVEVTASDALAFAHAVVTFAWDSAAGERLWTLTHRATLCLTTRDGAWKIVHEHASLPVDYESKQAIVER